MENKTENLNKTRQSKQCGFSIYTFDNLKSKLMVRLVRAEKMVLPGLVFARKKARMILIQSTHGRTDSGKYCSILFEQNPQLYNTLA